MQINFKNHIAISITIIIKNPNTKANVAKRLYLPDCDDGTKSLTTTKIVVPPAKAKTNGKIVLKISVKKNATIALTSSKTADNTPSQNDFDFEYPSA